MKHKYTSTSEKDTEKIAADFVKELVPGDIVFLIGELGVGKTTFVRGVAKALGIKTRILSPTFSLIRSHTVSNHEKIKKLHHVDLYRQEEKDVTIEQILTEFQEEKDAVTFIEWPTSKQHLRANWQVKIDMNEEKRVFTFVHRKDVSIQVGKIYIFPTDTAFGIGCRIDDNKSIERLFDIRNRPHDKAVPILVSSLKMAKEYGLFDASSEKLAREFWPGGLTIVVKARRKNVSNLVFGGGNTIGLRMPDHDTLLGMIRATGVPILGPSANFAGDKTPYSIKDVDNHLKNLADEVIDGNTKSQKSSTVIDTTQRPWKILREGAVSVDEIKKFYT